MIGDSAGRRDAYWCNLKGLLIALVVIGHFMQVFLERSEGYGDEKDQTVGID